MQRHLACAQTTVASQPAVVHLLVFQTRLRAHRKSGGTREQLFAGRQLRVVEQLSCVPILCGVVYQTPTRRGNAYIGRPSNSISPSCSSVASSPWLVSFDRNLLRLCVFVRGEYFRCGGINPCSIERVIEDGALP